jgi:hypothetical protein
MTSGNLIHADTYEIIIYLSPESYYASVLHNELDSSSFLIRKIFHPVWLATKLHKSKVSSYSVSNNHLHLEKPATALHN